MNTRRPLGFLATTALFAAMTCFMVWTPSGGLGQQQPSRTTGLDAIVPSPIEMMPNPNLKTSIYRDAIYFLDYKAGRLIVTIPPDLQKTGASSSGLFSKLKFREKAPQNNPSMFDAKASRDLVADFQLAPTSPARFFMATGQTGEMWANLYVLESSTHKLNVYKTTTKKNSENVSFPIFELLETRIVGDPSKGPMGDVSIQTGSISMFFNPVLQAAVSHDAIYILDADEGKLWVSAPAMVNSGGRKVIEPFAERNLRVDFKLPPSTPVRFVMSIGRIGMAISPLYVFETNSKLAGIYRAEPRSSGTSTEIVIQNMQVQSLIDNR